MALQGGVNNLNEGIVRSIAYQVSVSGAGALAALRTAQNDVTRAGAALYQQRQQNKITELEHQQGLAKLSQEFRQLEGAVKLADGAMANGGRVTDELVRKLKQKEGQVQRSTYAMFQLAYAIDDMQYGLPALTNNIVGMATGFASMAGASQEAMKYITMGSVAVVAASVVYNNWDKILGFVNKQLGIENPTKTATEQMKDLEKQTRRTADEEAKLVKLKKEEAAASKFASVMAKSGVSHQQAITDALESEAVGGGEEMKNRIEKSYMASGASRDPIEEEKMNKKIAILKRDRATRVTLGPKDAKIADFELERDINQLQEEYNKNRAGRAAQLAKDLMARVEKGGAGLDELIRFMERNEGTFGKDRIAAFKKATKPERMKAIQEELDSDLLKRQREASAAANEEITGRRDREIKDIARQYQGEYQSKADQGKAPDQVQIDADLTRRGVKGAKALAAEVMEIVREEYTRDLGEFMGQLAKEGVQDVTPEMAIKERERRRTAEAEAKSRAEQNRVLAEQRSKDVAAGRAERKLDQAHNAGVRKVVSELSPEMKKEVQKQQRQGSSDEAIRRRVKDRLRKANVPEELLDDAADEIFSKGNNVNAGKEAAKGMRMAAMAERAARGVDDTDPSKPFAEKAGESRSARLKRLQAWRKRKAAAAGGGQEAGGIAPRPRDKLDLPQSPVRPEIEPGSLVPGEGAQAMVDEQKTTNAHLADMRRGIRAEVMV